MRVVVESLPGRKVDGPRWCMLWLGVFEEFPAAGDGAWGLIAASVGEGRGSGGLVGRLRRGI